MLRTDRKSSTCGSAARMPRVSGSYPGEPINGFNQMSRKQPRCRRAISAFSISGSPRSQPSEMSSTTGPRRARGGPTGR